MREVATVYGDCQAGAVAEFLRATPAVFDRFEIIFHFVGLQDANHAAAWEDDLRRSSFLLLQMIKASSNYVVHSLTDGRLPTVIRFAPIGLPSMWPFDTAFGGDDAQAKLLCRAHTRPHMHFFDALHAKLRPMGDAHARLQAYRTLTGTMPAEAASFIKRREFQRVFDYDVYRLQQADNFIGTSIGRYVISNFRKRRLFHSLGHPAAEIIAMIAREALMRIGIQPGLSGPTTDTMSYYQVPIHPVVAEVLGLEWVLQDITYRVYDEELTFEQYQMCYITEYG